MSEADLQTAVIQLAQLRGWLVHHCRPGQTAGGRWATQLQGDAGFPDLVLARAGELLFVELKSQRGKTSPSQDAWLHRLGTVGGMGPGVIEIFVWKPADWSSGEIERQLA